MRKYREATARNLLHDPKVMGVSLPGLVGLSFTTLLTSTLTSQWKYSPVLTLSMATLGYIGLRVHTKLAHNGSEERLIFALECLAAQTSVWINAQGRKPKHAPIPKLHYSHAPIKITAPDTLTESDMLYKKSKLLDYIAALRPAEVTTLHFTYDENGLDVGLIKTQPTLNLKIDTLMQALRCHITLNAQTEYSPSACFVYSLINLPATTDPLWLPSLLKRAGLTFEVFVRLDGVDHYKTKRLIEAARRRNMGAATNNSVDGEVSFEESTSILEGLIRGDESVVRLGLVVVSHQPLDLDPHYFMKEASPWLSLSAVTGLRRRPHRSFLVRAVTATDLLPTLDDPIVQGEGALKTRFNRKAAFRPDDERLDALHWLVVGASGAGKSFFTALILRRQLLLGLNASVLYLDHNRGFKRFLVNDGYSYSEPATLSDLKFNLKQALEQLNTAGTMAGLELSDLILSEKKQAARLVLQSISEFLKNRDSTHTLYLVLDECWNFLRDEPALVQQVFREFRKLNGAAIAITQSLSDFLRDESGQSIVQNAPIRILLRQGEDMAPYRGTLGLNDTEILRVRELKQVRGEFSECLIKTPFMSRILRLYPTTSEHDLLRTDNLRREYGRPHRAVPQ